MWLAMAVLLTLPMVVTIPTSFVVLYICFSTLDTRALKIDSLDVASRSYGNLMYYDSSLFS